MKTGAEFYDWMIDIQSDGANKELIEYLDSFTKHLKDEGITYAEYVTRYEKAEAERELYDHMEFMLIECIKYELNKPIQKAKELKRRREYINKQYKSKRELYELRMGINKEFNEYVSNNFDRGYRKELGKEFIDWLVERDSNIKNKRKQKTR